MPAVSLRTHEDAGDERSGVLLDAPWSKVAAKWDDAIKTRAPFVSFN